MVRRGGSRHDGTNRPDGAHAPRPPAAVPHLQQPDGAGTALAAQGPAREENEPPARPAGHRPG